MTRPAHQLTAKLDTLVHTHRGSNYRRTTQSSLHRRPSYRRSAARLVRAAQMLLLGVLVLSLSAALAHATGVEIFHESFDNVTGFSGHDPINPGLPQMSEGADELWYGARFEYFDGGTVEQDLAVQQFGGGGNSTPVGRFEDDAGLVIKLDTSLLTDANLSFDWRNFDVDTPPANEDDIVVGYTTLDLDSFFDANRIADFYNDPNAGNGDNSQAEAWWANNWTELLRADGQTNFKHEQFSLPSESELWVAFWIDNGEHEFIKLDNVWISGELIPEPTSFALMGMGLVLAGTSRRGHSRKRRQS